MSHRWIEVPEGSALTNYHPFRFCTRCDLEELSDGTTFRHATAPDLCELPA